MAALFKISELTKKDIINLKDGAKLGPVKDAHFDLAEGRIKALVLEGPRKMFGLFSAGGDVVVTWDKIKIIGKDAVLVQID
ncbi:MAG: YlmC/YmxH family sporulation protein [Desulfotomaculaceae bacterium]